MISTIENGDIFASDAQAIVNPVNCVGVMGKGLAKQFRDRFPSMFADYQKAISLGELQIGRCMVCLRTAPNLLPNDLVRYIICCPTKGHWSETSNMDTIRAGLYDLRNLIDRLQLRSLAIPALGCGEGGLSWPEVHETMLAHFADVGDECEIELYAPPAENAA